MWTMQRMPEQSGRVAVVTGGNSGLGLICARELARKGAHIVIAARDGGKAAAAREAIVTEVPGSTIEVRPLDLSSLASVRECAEGIAADHPKVDVLLNNAGVMGLPEQRTAEGFEMQWGVNHLGHFVLTNRLLPALLRADAPRVVTVTSFARLVPIPVRSARSHPLGRYDPWVAYCQSKRANLHFAVELDLRLRAAGAGIASLAAHPGLSLTDLQARSVRETGGGWSQRFFHGLARRTGMSPDRAALPQLRAATDEAARGGELYGPRWGTRGAPVRRPRPLRWTDRRPARRLWEISARAADEPFDIAAAVRDIG